MAETAPPAAQAATAVTATPAPASATTSTESAAAAKLSGAELKAKKKAEKAARREQSKASEPAPAAAPAPASGNDRHGGGKQNKPKQDAPGTPAANRTKKPVPTPAPVAPPKQPPGPVVPETFSHLPMAKKLPLSKADKDVHPAVLAIGQQMATFTLKDSVARLEATLMAFRKVSNLSAHQKCDGTNGTRSSSRMRARQDMCFPAISYHTFSTLRSTT